MFQELLTCFGTIEEPRQVGKVDHLLIDVLGSLCVRCWRMQKRLKILRFTASIKKMVAAISRTAERHSFP